MIAGDQDRPRGSQRRIGAGEGGAAQHQFLGHGRQDREIGEVCGQQAGGVEERRYLLKRMIANAASAAWSESSSTHSRPHPAPATSVRLSGQRNSSVR